ncbi:MAG: ATP-binding protein [Ilumatobacteraceae bacterium]
MADGVEVLQRSIGELAERLAVLADGSGDPSWTPIVEPFDTAADPPVPGDRLHTLVDAIGLDHVDLSVMMCAAAAALDARFGTVFGGLADGQRHSGATVGIILQANGLSSWDPSIRQRFGADSMLSRAELLDVTTDAPTLLEQTVTVPERVISWLLGDDTPDPRLIPLLTPTAGLSTDDVISVCRALQAGLWNVWIHDGAGGGPSLAASALAVLGAPSIVMDLRRLPAGSSLSDVLPLAWREAALTGGGIVAGPVDATRDATALARLPANPIRPTVLVSGQSWDPSGSAVVPVEIIPSPMGPPDREGLWGVVLDALDIDIPGAATELSALRLAPEQVQSAAIGALGAATADDEPLSLTHLRSAALAHGSNRLNDLAQHVVPIATFDDLVAPEELMSELRSLPGRHRTRHVVRDEWGLGRGGGRGSGLTCLFAGPSGTGKTLAAEVVANAVGVDLFIIDLSQIVDKYIGETEKNLERVFTEAESVNGVLLFDEADALFGKRSGVQSSHDRHANIEVAYLLQRMERYDGIAVLTTNFRGNIDEAFQRRLDVVCSFPEPDADERRELWVRHLPPGLPIEPDVDLDLLAERLAVSGGVIRNITLTAAHTAAVNERSVTMADLVAAAAREYRKMGRLFNQVELSAWISVD